MANQGASELILANEQGVALLKAFAVANEIETLGELLSFPMSTLARMRGYNIHIQNEIIDLATRHDLLPELKQY